MVLQSRQVLGSLLLQWPRDGPRINTLQLGNLDSTRWFSLLDFLLKGLPVDTQDKVIHTYIHIVVAIFSYIRIIFFEPYSFFMYNQPYVHLVFVLLFSVFLRYCIMWLCAVRVLS